MADIDDVPECSICRRKEGDVTNLDRTKLLIHGDLACAHYLYVQPSFALRECTLLTYYRFHRCHRSCRSCSDRQFAKVTHFSCPKCGRQVFNKNLKSSTFAEIEVSNDSATRREVYRTYASTLCVIASNVTQTSSGTHGLCAFDSDS
jgi:predicted RNA-binding Zn-ribbon protein involved in translation (DUF1610 family)